METYSTRGVLLFAAFLVLLRIVSFVTSGAAHHRRELFPIARIISSGAVVSKVTPILLSMANVAGNMHNVGVEEVDPEYPGTAVTRMRAVRERVRSLTRAQLNDDWEEVRRRLLWAGGLRDLPNAMPGQGYTGHSFNDFNHCDLTTMAEEVVSHDNNGQVEYVAVRNPLGMKCSSLLHEMSTVSHV